MIQLVGMQELEAVQRSVFLMSGQQIDDHWPNIQILMDSCPGYYDLYTPEWTYQSAKSGDIQMWALSDGAIRGIIVTQILVFPAQKVFEIVGAAGIGLLDFFDEMEKVFEYIAADAGCKTIMGRCRPGVERLIVKKYGGYKCASWVWKSVDPARRQ
jgi:hypothetical protein